METNKNINSEQILGGFFCTNLLVEVKLSFTQNSMVLAKIMEPGREGKERKKKESVVCDFKPLYV